MKKSRSQNGIFFDFVQPISLFEKPSQEEEFVADEETRSIHAFTVHTRSTNAIYERIIATRKRVEAAESNGPNRQQCASIFQPGCGYVATKGQLSSITKCFKED